MKCVCGEEDFHLCDECGEWNCDCGDTRCYCFEPACCSCCAGTGEGTADGTRCVVCKGKGEV